MFIISFGEFSPSLTYASLTITWTCQFVYRDYGFWELRFLGLVLLVRYGVFIFVC
jgi:hypothetical protein